jgi:hypothetical protein
MRPDDRTQGPACAVAAGAATIYRNYFASVDNDVGQTADRQLDGLKSLGVALSAALDTPVEALWKMRNGYPPRQVNRGEPVACRPSHVAYLVSSATASMRGRN